MNTRIIVSILTLVGDVAMLQEPKSCVMKLMLAIAVAETSTRMTLHAPT